MTMGCTKCRGCSVLSPASSLTASTQLCPPPLPGVSAQETGKRAPRARNRRLAHYDGGKTQAVSQAQFIYVNMHTFVCTNIWNLLPQNLALLHIQYEITRNRCEISTLTPEQKLRDDGLCI